jgi:hypothetical protein
MIMMILSGDDDVICETRPFRLYNRPIRNNVSKKNNYDQRVVGGRDDC